MMTLAAVLRELTVEGVVLCLVNLVLAIAMVLGVGSARRLIRQNDEAHKAAGKRIDNLSEALGGRIEQLTGAIAAEREARHDSHKDLTDRVWSVSADLKENYPPRRETMRQFGTLIQKIDALGSQINGRLDDLPCTKPSCPAPPAARGVSDNAA
ncbi:MAG TPA: hypothetical protein VMW52_12580 [Phycisphaerae bacterium]|nr:hypothetical protein [Phycisphaerae bacterium]